MRKYSEKFLNNYKILTQSTIGLEIEFFSNHSFYKTLEFLNNELAPVKVHGFNTYHATFVPDKDNFKMELDLSGGSNMREIVTGPLDYQSARYYLIKLLQFVDKYGYTTDKSSIHINISFGKESKKQLINLNILKHILKTDEEDIYRVFTNRKNNIYAKSIKKMIPFKDYDFSNVNIASIANVMKLPDDRYYGVNYLHMDEYDSCRLEYRYIGGEGYEERIGDILDMMDRFVITTWNCIDEPFDTYDTEELEFYLSKNITNFKQFSNYDNFLIEFPTIRLQIDQRAEYDIVNSYFSKIYDKLFIIVDSIDSLKECIINYVTSTHELEIVGGEFKSILNIRGYNFINCKIMDGIYYDSTFYNCEVINTQLEKCKLDMSQIKTSKITNCTTETSTLDDCFVMGGYLNSVMNGGIFRSGKIGPSCILSSTTKIVEQPSTEGMEGEISDEKKLDSKWKGK